VQVRFTPLGFLEVRLKELQSNQTTLLANTKESERLEAEKHLRNELSALDGKIKELQAAQTVSEQQRLLDVEHAKTELQNQLQGERTKNADLNRNVQGYLVEISNLRETNNALEAEMSKIVRVGRREEVDFAERDPEKLKVLAAELQYLLMLERTVPKIWRE
jgi:hypothetical protein